MEPVMGNLICYLPIFDIVSLRYSTGAVRDYIPNGCVGPDLPLTIPGCDNVRSWYNLGGFQLFFSMGEW
jgi:hypothetical protein